MKRILLSALLIGSLAAIPPQSRAKSYRPDNAVVMVGCLLVIGVGVIVIIQLKKLCDKTPPVDGVLTNSVPPPPTTTPTNPPATNAPPKKPWWHLWALNDGNVTYTVSASTPGQFYAAWNFQTAPALSGPWTTLYHVQSWIDYTGEVTQWTDPAGAIVWVSHCQPEGSDTIPLDVGNGNEPQKFYRISQ